MTEIMYQFIIFAMMLILSFAISYLFFENESRATLFIWVILNTLACFTNVLDPYFLTANVLILALLVYTLVKKT